MASIADLRKKWNENKLDYKTREVGSGVHSFLADVFESAELFGLKKTAAHTGKLSTFVNDTKAGEKGRPDFVLYISNDFHVPVEAKCFTHIEDGVAQLRRYQLDTAKRYKKQYGILTDGYEWRFYRAASFTKFLLPDILDDPNEFLAFWCGYIKPENYYIEVFNSTGQQNLFLERIDLNVPANRPLFFDDVTHLIGNFKAKMKAVGTWELFDNADKVAIETSYAYLIQFILYKVLVDNGYSKFTEQYDSLFRSIKLAVQKEDLYRFITSDVRTISEYISKHIYKPFAEKQESINEKLMEKLTGHPTIDEIAPWLDIIIFIDKYDFANVKNEIFGFVYENYLKDLYGDKNKGQYFTDPEVVNFMLDQVGYTENNLEKGIDNISLIDPSCGAGTFLYSAVDRIIGTYAKDDSKSQSELVESLVDKNIFGLDIEEFPLFLAEMSILMRLLPLIVNDNYENPIDNKLKVFKTKDSISEFLDAGLVERQEEIDFPALFSQTDLGYHSFMRDNKNLQEMIESMQGANGGRMRFDFVIGNPPYVGYLETNKQGVEFTKKIKAKSPSISMGNVYDVNLHSVPGRKKPYAPMPNLYAFFFALGLALLKDNGRICYIVPQNLLTAGDLDVLRYHLAKNVTIEKIITFGGKLFVGRGLKQKKQITTSSLVFVAKKSSPTDRHNVKITNFSSYADKQDVNFERYFRSRNKENKEVLQKELLEKVENWNFIKHSHTELLFLGKYFSNAKSIEEYRQSDLAHYNEVQFDRGVKFDKKKIDIGTSDWSLIKKNQGCYTIGLNGKHIATEFIILPKGAQGLQLFDNKYKILWRYMNFDQFYFSKEKIMLDFNWIVISSNNKNEMLFLLAILNSRLSRRLFDLYLKNDNEQAVLLGIKSIKQYIRIPSITSGNRAIKAEIIKQTESLLALETITLRDIVNFDTISVQKFDSASVSGNQLVLVRSGKEFKCKIQKGKSELVAGVIAKIFAPDEPVSLSILKSASALDFDAQAAIKAYIDDLVFALYFNVPLSNIGIAFAPTVRKKCEASEFYTVIST